MVEKLLQYLPSLKFAFRSREPSLCGILMCLLVVLVLPTLQLQYSLEQFSGVQTHLYGPSKSESQGLFKNNIKHLSYLVSTGTI